MITVQEIKKVNNIGNINAFVSIKIDDLIIHDFKIVQQSGQKAWVSVPQTSYKNQQDKTCYKNLIELSKELKEEISKEILKNWN